MLIFSYEIRAKHGIVFVTDAVTEKKRFETLHPNTPIGILLLFHDSGANDKTIPTVSIAVHCNWESKQFVLGIIRERFGFG